MTRCSAHTSITTPHSRGTFVSIPSIITRLCPSASSQSSSSSSSTQVEESNLLHRVSTANFQFPPEEMSVLSLIDAATGGTFDATHPLWPSVMKLKQRKIIVQAGTSPPCKFHLSDPFLAAVLGAQQSNTILPTLVAQLRGRGLESLLNPCPRF
jgi:hypothetical protein